MRENCGEHGLRRCPPVAGMQVVDQKRRFRIRLGTERIPMRLQSLPQFLIVYDPVMDVLRPCS